VSLKTEDLPRLHVYHTSLKDQAARHLREMIVSGRIPAGSKITERDVAQWLEISRMPARDALMELENQGLVVSKADSRYVIQPTPQEVRQLYQLRLALEKLAVELAITSASERRKDQLQRKLDAMRRAVERGDQATYTASDLEMHELIWQQAGNPYLLNSLHALTGPIFMFIASQTRVKENWTETLALHEALVQAICAGDAAAALHSVEAHLQRSLDLALQVFQGGNEK
jgi:DNA-binding GntR family transcriptional regulator